MSMWSAAAALTLLSLSGCPAATSTPDVEGVCLAHEDCSGQAEYPWPTARGRAKPGLYGIAEHAAPKDWPKKLAWTFSGLRGNHSEIWQGGVAIDNERNIYVAAHDALYKLNEFGTMMWTYPVPTSTMPVIHKGLLYSNSKEGRAFALDMRTGQIVFNTKLSEFIGNDIAGVGVSDGVFVTSAGGALQGGDSAVVGLNASDGQELWRYSSEAQLWNFMPMFTGEGTFIFQDQLGGVYHLETATGKLLWKSGYKGSWQETWTDGVAMLGPNRMVYVTHAGCHMLTCSPVEQGTLRAYHLDSGELAWSQVTPYSPNSQPLVARLGKNPGYSVVMPIGQPAHLPPSFRVFNWMIPQFIQGVIVQISVWLGDRQTAIWGNKPYPSVVRAYDAETGEEQWSWTPPDLLRGYSSGDEELLIPRLSAGNTQPVCLPNLWASATMDAEGTIFMGHANGRIYALRDSNADGAIDPKTEVEEYDTSVAFSHGGMGVAKGMAVIANCDQVLVFKD